MKISIHMPDCNVQDILIGAAKPVNPDTFHHLLRVYGKAVTDKEFGEAVQRIMDELDSVITEVMGTPFMQESKEAARGMFAVKMELSILKVPVEQHPGYATRFLEIQNLIDSGKVNEYIRGGSDKGVFLNSHFIRALALCEMAPLRDENGNVYWLTFDPEKVLLKAAEEEARASEKH